MGNAVSTDTAVFQAIAMDAAPICDIVEMFISNHDFRKVRGGEECQEVAEYVALFHQADSHTRVWAKLCRDHMKRWAVGVCPNPVCQAPRLLDVRPL